MRYKSKLICWNDAGNNTFDLKDKIAEAMEDYALHYDRFHLKSFMYGTGVGVILTIVLYFLT